MDQPNQFPAEPDRRKFLRQAGVLGAAVAGAAVPALVRGALPLTRPGGGLLPRKPFGKTDDKVSILGIGGSSLGDAPSLEEATRITHEAIEAGVTFFDNAWEYHRGRSEEWMGKALKGKRDKVFLMTKVCTHGRGKDVAMKQLEESLQRLQTDHLDLWQVHECVYDNDPDLHFAKGGVVEALDEAKKQGKVRYVGFTGHKDPSIHLKMLAHDYPFDSVQMPLNPFDGTFRSFEQHVLPVIAKKGMAGLGMKSLGGSGGMITKGAVTIEEALGYALSLPVATTISGIDSIAVLRQNLEIARNFQPWTDEQMETLRKRCAKLAADGHLELYKSTRRFDSEIGREQHGYPPADKLPL